MPIAVLHPVFFVAAPPKKVSRGNRRTTQNGNHCIHFPTEFGNGEPISPKLNRPSILPRFSASSAAKLFVHFAHSNKKLAAEFAELRRKEITVSISGLWKKLSNLERPKIARVFFRAFPRLLRPNSFATLRAGTKKVSRGNRRITQKGRSLFPFLSRTVETVSQYLQT